MFFNLRGDVMVEESIETGAPYWESLTGWDRTFHQMWHLQFGPEIERRQAAGALDRDFYLYMAQYLQPPDQPSRVLFNDEVEGVALMRSPRAVEHGDPVTVADMAHIEHFDLPDDLLDCGHFTIIRADGDAWRMFFNFLSGRAKAGDMLERASHFLEAAFTSAEKNHPGPAIENLFSASELISKSELILSRNPAVGSRKHSAISAQINKWARLGNIDQSFVHLFNRLSRERGNARYGDTDHMPSMPTSDELELVSAMIERGRNRIARSTDRSRHEEASPGN